MKFARSYISLCLVLLETAHAGLPANINNLNCTLIPHSNNSLCYSVAYGDIAPYVDWELYLKYGDELQLHSCETLQLAVPGSFLFSPNGLYLAQEFTEEGHPHFIIYKTESFLNNKQAKPLGYFEDYYLEDIIAFDDNGELIYRLIPDQCDESKTNCIKRINFLNTP